MHPSTTSLDADKQMEDLLISRNPDHTKVIQHLYYVRLDKAWTNT